MDPERWQRIDKLLEQTLEQEPDRRAAFLDEACNGDAALRQEVGSLLSAHGKAGGFTEATPMRMSQDGTGKEGQDLTGLEVGHYQVLSRLGEGGMGVVYKARDTLLGRTVALKILPPELVNDPDRKRRFVQEAKAASALNHPNIVTIYEIASDGIDFIVMEYVAGKTLDQLIPRRGLKLRDLLKYSIQIADGLAKAHAAGIVHRDLKPGNVMVTEEGVVKVLDFGLAKLTQVEYPEGETSTLESLTEEGMIIGTVSYMSPEQAEGKKIDARSDIFSFGSVLYEMVSGQKAFEGDTKMSTLSAILKQEAKPISQTVPGIPQDLEKIINRCLRKDPTRRFQTLADLKVTLEELKEEKSANLAETPLSKSASQGDSGHPLGPQARKRWVWAGAALAVVAIAVAAWLLRGTARRPAAAPEVVPLTSDVGLERAPSFSPDGNQVAFSWNREKQDNFDIYVKLIGSSEPHRLTTDPAADVCPAFSPDGLSIGFVRMSKERATFMVIPVIGGRESEVTDVTLPDHWRDAFFSWFPDGKWIVTRGLKLISTETGETRSLTSPPTKSVPDTWPAVSPDGRTVAFGRSDASMGSIYLLDLTEDLKPKGEPRRLTSLKASLWGLAWKPDGQDIIFSSGLIGDWKLWKMPTSGPGEPEPLPFTGVGIYPAISRSGNRMAYQNAVCDTNIWRLSLSDLGVAAGVPSQIVSSTRGEDSAQYSPDGKRIAFSSDRSGRYGVWASDADGSKPEELFSSSDRVCGGPHWSPDGQRIAFASNLKGNFDIYIIRVSGRRPERLTSDSSGAWSASWSRDGEWVYFASARTGRCEVWKVPTGGGKEIQVTRNGGVTAIESPDGESIYYLKEDPSSGLWKMPLRGGEESQVLPSVLWDAFSLVNEGIYFIPGPQFPKSSSIQFLSFATGAVKTVAPMSAPYFAGLSISPDGRFLLFSQLDDVVSDLMLVENFR